MNFLELDMTVFEGITILISAIALAISIWNFIRISDLDQKEEYKSKNTLFHETYSEVMALIQNIENRINIINEKRLALHSVNSPYIGSYGFGKGHEAILKEIRKTNPIKEELNKICEKLEGITKKEDKEAFDYCMQIKIEIKKKILEVDKILGQAELTINDMHSMAQGQKNS